jgi:DNA-binding NarL/FixJ family response regulator
MKKIKVLLADDHPDLLKRVSALLRTSPTIDVVATAENGEKAVELAQATQPDVLILDIDMPKLNGLQAIVRARMMGLAASILILSIYDDPSIVRAAFKQGASGYVLKSRATTDLIEAVHEIVYGKQFISAPIAKYINSSSE